MQQRRHANNRLTPYPTTGLIQNLDASRPETMITSGGTVIQWLDISGNENHVTVASGDTAPTAVLENGLIVPTFSSGTQKLSKIFSSSVTGAATVAILVRTLAGTGVRIPWSTPGGQFIYIDGVQLKTHFGTGYGNCFNINPNRYELFVFSLSNAFMQWFQTNMATTGALAPTGDGNFLGINGSIVGPALGAAWQGSIRQLMIWDYAMSDIQIYDLRDAIYANMRQQHMMDETSAFITFGPTGTWTTQTTSDYSDGAGKINTTLGAYYEVMVPVGYTKIVLSGIITPNTAFSSVLKNGMVVTSGNQFNTAGNLTGIYATLTGLVAGDIIRHRSDTIRGSNSDFYCDRIAFYTS